MNVGQVSVFVCVGFVCVCVCLDVCGYVWCVFAECV